MLHLDLLTFATMLPAGAQPWGKIPEAFRLTFPLILFFVELFVLAVTFYLSGLIIVGEKASLADSFILSLLGIVLSTIFLMFIPYGLISLFLSIIVWLLLIKHFFKTGWLKAVAVAILAVIIYFVILILIALAFGILEIILQLLRSSTSLSLEVILFEP